MKLSNHQVTVMLPVKDMARARSFHERQLALVPLGEKSDGKFVYPCGVTENPLFNDPEGNILCLHEDIPDQP